VEVEVKVYGRLSEMLNIREFKINVETEITLRKLLENLNKLNEKFLETIAEENGTLKQGYILLVNGESVENLNHRVKPGDRIDILPPAVGGSTQLAK
jgi:MoaD family protein